MPTLDGNKIAKARAKEDATYAERFDRRNRRRDARAGAKVPDPAAIAYDVRSGRRGHEFTRCGISFGDDLERVPADALSKEQRAHLLNSKPRDLLVTEIGPKGPIQGNHTPVTVITPAAPKKA